MKALGGLFVLGTERHEARRIDNQLRGRSGRQGDPGETQFFVSLEDSLMRIFAGDRIKGIMGRLGVAEDEPIENKLINSSLEGAQKKIEGFNFDSRKHILEYDDVLNHQRKTIYERRRSILTGSIDDVAKALNDVVETVSIEPIVLNETTKIPARADVQAMVEKKVNELSKEAFYKMIRQIMLQAIDLFWVDHLELMDYTRSSVGLRSYGQRDPLVEYKREGLRLFKSMQGAINAQILDLIPHVSVGGVAPSQGYAQGNLKEVHVTPPAVGAIAGAATPDASGAGNRKSRRAAQAVQGGQGGQANKQSNNKR